mmetsp:Transcript_27788/g.65314  ORF Transcript_27788/g.65314 Transcript_27788/m.65314 type:complete len:172 (+) Transcript_27788:1436-1951(+)
MRRSMSMSRSSVRNGGGFGSIPGEVIFRAGSTRDSSSRYTSCIQTTRTTKTKRTTSSTYSRSCDDDNDRIVQRSVAFPNASSPLESFDVAKEPYKPSVGDTCPQTITTNKCGAHSRSCIRDKNKLRGEGCFAIPFVLETIGWLRRAHLLQIPPSPFHRDAGESHSIFKKLT